MKVAQFCKYNKNYWIGELRTALNKRMVWYVIYISIKLLIIRKAKKSKENIGECVYYLVPESSFTYTHTHTHKFLNKLYDIKPCKKRPY